jgi:hypothetical protein
MSARRKRNRFLTIALCAASAVAIPLPPRCLAAVSGQQTQPAASGAANRRVGAVKAINGTAITLTPDSGPDVNITVQPNARILRIAPGEKDLKNATPIQLQDLQVGDRILVGGKPSDDNLSLAATTIVVMKHSDLEAQHEKDLQDWQKRGVGGLVTAVDAGAGTVTISVGSFAAKKSIVIHTSGITVIRRYAPDSVKFDDAKPGTLQEIHSGDQLRARGDRNADGSELTAQEIVSGSFRNIAGTVTSADASSSTINVQDLLSKKLVVVKVTADSQLRRLPPEMAQRIAARLKAAALGGVAGTASSAGSGASAAPSSSPPNGNGPGGNAAGGRSGGAPDFQQMLSRLPAVAVTDLHKGDAVIILATEGTAGVGAVITLVGGVEPMLQAAPSASSAAMLAPWSMGAPSGDSGGP